MVNKRYYQLDDPEWLKSQRQKKSMSQLAKEISIEECGDESLKQTIAGCIRFMELKMFSKEIRSYF